MKVTILIVNFRNWEDTIECLESVFKSSYKYFEVIVVDNSPDHISINNLHDWALGNVRIEQTRFPELVFPEKAKPLNFISFSEEEYFEYDSQVKKDIIFIKARDNHGFAAANNIVLKKLLESNKNEFVFLLNNDTVLPKDTIYNLVNNYSKENFGLVGCVLLEYSDPKKVQSVGGVYNKFWGTSNQVIGGKSLEIFKEKNKKERIDYPVGAAMFLSIKVLNEIGLLNESYFLFYEELDWVKKAKEKVIKASEIAKDTFGKLKNNNYLWKQKSI